MPESSTKEFIFVMGGARSGKSSWALRYAEENYGSYLYLATAEVLDEEMAERVRLHRESRSAKWRLVEEPLMIAEALETKCAGVDAVLIDCLTVWLSNVLLKMGDEQIATYEDSLFEAISRKKQSIIAVANEVGTGVVPEYALGRKFRDLAGSLNQRIAGMADKVIYMIAGLPMCLKGNQD
ncbi:MAG: bifunctional adenosylcobinamide kinase/adenosylcobinamide-phosphate guanylyltransferase [Deltaproteobacteria bacterium]|nr:bifunctional adenosylcobinamide kinase/adenosylcobinamide-phosphate guanylyltransferase [Deltaproteobacteria bacterium]